jgi:hypothetical protein
MDPKDSILKAINKTLSMFDFEEGLVTNYMGDYTECEFAGCDRKAMYYVNSPVYDNRYNTVYTYSCAIHVGHQTLEIAAKWVDKELDQHYCAVCESRAYACDCEPLKAIGIQRKAEKVSFNTCRICLCDMSEHNWEIHNAEARAETL